MASQRVHSSASAFPGRALTLVLGSLALGLSAFLLDHIVRMHGRLEHLESSHLDESIRMQRSMYSHISDLRGVVDATTEEARVAATLYSRLKDTESLLGDMGQVMEAHTSSINQLANDHAVFDLEDRWREHEEQLEGRWESLDQKVEIVQSVADESRREVQLLESAVRDSRDPSKMWHDLVGPVVQLSGETSVGSGVLLRSRLDTETGVFRTHLMTAWHVVRDIQGDLSKTELPVPVAIYAEDGSVESVLAKLLVFDMKLDAALLEITSEEALACGADLPTREQLANLRIFDRVYAVGCPLGNDPIPTAGEIAAMEHEVDGESYMMINAATYIGNSGGGIFAAGGHQLLGIFSKIYTHGTLRPTIVPHMGLVTPMSDVYDWLESRGFESIIPVTEATGEEKSERVAYVPR